MYNAYNIIIHTLYWQRIISSLGRIIFIYIYIYYIGETGLQVLLL